MPQMMPLNWSTLYIYFSLLLMMFSLINYYLFISPTNKIISNKYNMSFMYNWKW